MRANRNLMTIPLEECQHRHVYRLRSNNLTLGVFNLDAQGFIGIREKFRQRFLFTEYHWDTGEPYGTANPYEDLAELPEHIELRENDPPIDIRRGRRVEWRAAENSESGTHADWFYLDDDSPMGFSEDDPFFPVVSCYRPLFDYLDGFASDKS